MKVVVIPDVHNKIDLADAIIEKEHDASKYIFLGDIFDDYHDSIADIKRVATWVKNKVHDPRYIFLWGNHDISYGFANVLIPCGGYDIHKDVAVWQVLNREDFNPWKFFWVTQGFLLSHGGLHPNFLPPVWKRATMSAIKRFLLKESEKCLMELNQPHGDHWFFLAGDARCRPKRGVEAGGLLWCDTNEEFEPIPEISQVFGHTHQGSYPRIIYGDTGLGVIHDASVLKINIEAKDKWNVALDCRMRYYAVIEDGMLRILSTPNFSL